MKKDAYYFSHDANSQDDPKCMILIDQLGMEGYGIFWALIEKLRSEKDYKLPLSILNSLAKRWTTSKEKVESVVFNYNLFIVEENHFFSLRLERSMTEKSERARLSAGYRWNDATAMQLHTERNANGMRNDAIKVKKSKEKENKEESKEEIEMPFTSESFRVSWLEWKDYRLREFGRKFKSPKTEQTALSHLAKIAGGKGSRAEEIITQSIGNQYQGLFPIKDLTNGSSAKTGSSYTGKSAGAHELLEELRANPTANTGGK